jgi:ankyrin repeat protein
VKDPPFGTGFALFSVTPFAFMLFNLNAVLDMKPGFPTFLDLLILSLVLYVSLQGISSFMGQGAGTQATLLVTAILELAGGIATAAVYWWRIGTSKSLAAQWAVLVFLFSLGLATLCNQLLLSALDHITSKDLPAYLSPVAYSYGPMHLIFPPFMVWLRPYTLGWIGTRWLAQQLQRGRMTLSKTQVICPQARGNLPEVEAAIANDDDLDLFICLHENGHRQHDGKYTLLMLAANNGHAHAASELINAGAAVDLMAPGSCQTALIMAVQSGHADIVLCLINAGANLEQPNAYGQTALHVACLLGELECARLIVERGGAIVSQEDLLVAAGGGHRGIAQLLNVDDAQKWVPLKAEEAIVMHERRQIASLTQSNPFCWGMLAFLLGNCSYGIATAKWAFNLEGGNGWVLFPYAILQTGGLLLMTWCECSIDEHLRTHGSRAIGFAMLWIFYCASLVSSSVTAMYAVVEAMPMLYLLARFRSIVGCQNGFVRFSTLFVLSLVLDASAGVFVPVWLFSGCCWWPEKANAIYCIFGSVAILLVYYRSRSRREAPCLQLNMAIYAYLFVIATQYMFYYRQWGTTPNELDVVMSSLFTPIHLVPTVAMLLFKKRIRKRLGRAWLRRRRDSASNGNGTVFIGDKSGTLHGVEEAMASHCDLNAYVCSTCNDDYTLLHCAAWNNNTAAVKMLVDVGVNLDVASRPRGITPLHLTCQRGYRSIAEMLVKAGADVNKRTANGHTPLLEATARGHAGCVRLLCAHGAEEQRNSEDGWMNLSVQTVARTVLAGSVLKVLRAYESEFVGNILEREGCSCVVSWPGRYAQLWDQLVEKGKSSELSAAVVFLPEHTEAYGQHAGGGGDHHDGCWCESIYGEKKPWGCRWFELWKAHVERAVRLKQVLRVFYFEGQKGKGKAASWGACRQDAIKRDALASRKAAFLQGLPDSEKRRLEMLSCAARHDAQGETPGSERGDEEDRLFLASLPRADRQFLEVQNGLGSSQKAEVAWLERCGYTYEEWDVRDFDPVDSSAPRFSGGS